MMCWAPRMDDRVGTLSMPFLEGEDGGLVGDGGAEKLGGLLGVVALDGEDDEVELGTGVLWTFYCVDVVDLAGFPVSLSMQRPWSRMAWRWGPRATKVTFWPVSTRREPTKPPTPPEPIINTRMVLSFLKAG